MPPIEHPMTPCEAWVVQTCIADLLAAGYFITVNDGKEDLVIAERDPQIIFDAMGKTNEESLLVSKPRCLDSFVRFVYSSNAWDVINDNGVSLEASLKRTHALCARIEEVFKYLMEYRRTL